MVLYQYSILLPKGNGKTAAGKYRAEGRFTETASRE